MDPRQASVPCKYEEGKTWDVCVSQLAKHWDRASSDEAAVAPGEPRVSSLEARVFAGRTQFCHARHWTGTPPRLEGRRPSNRGGNTTEPGFPMSGGCAPPPLASRIHLGSRVHLGECFERTWNSLECLVGRQCLPSPLRQDVEKS